MIESSAVSAFLLRFALSYLTVIAYVTVQQGEKLNIELNRRDRFAHKRDNPTLDKDRIFGDTNLAGP
jgi:hypothetical protein